MTGQTAVTLESNSRLRAGVELTGVFFRYPKGPDLFADLSLTIHSGESVGIIGPSGCGKSTLLRLVAGLLDPVKGTIRIDGAEPAASARTGGVAFAFQEPRLLPWMNCIDNVKLPSLLLRRQSSERLLSQLLSAFGLSESEKNFPHQLSGGLLQRASLARALLCEPKILLLDEPLSSVDWPLRRSILVLLRAFCRSRGVTVIVVSHDSRELVFLCDRILAMGTTPASGVRRFEVSRDGLGNDNDFKSEQFFRNTLALDDFAYPPDPGPALR